jgi:hypothetical protein
MPSIASADSASSATAGVPADTSAATRRWAPEVRRGQSTGTGGEPASTLEVAYRVASSRASAASPAAAATRAIRRNESIDACGSRASVASNTPGSAAAIASGRPGADAVSATIASNSSGNAAGIAASASSIRACPGASAVRRKASAISRDRAGAATIAGSARTASAMAFQSAPEKPLIASATSRKVRARGSPGARANASDAAFLASSTSPRLSDASASASQLGTPAGNALTESRQAARAASLRSSFHKASPRWKRTSTWRG